MIFIDDPEVVKDVSYDKDGDFTFSEMVANQVLNNDNEINQKTSNRFMEHCAKNLSSASQKLVPAVYNFVICSDCQENTVFDNIMRVFAAQSQRGLT